MAGELDPLNRHYYVSPKVELVVQGNVHCLQLTYLMPCCHIYISSYQHMLFYITLITLV